MRILSIRMPSTDLSLVSITIQQESDSLINQYIAQIGNTEYSYFSADQYVLT